MARATAAGALDLFGGTYPPGHSATTFGYFIDHADALVDTAALPGTVSTTGANEITLGDKVLYRLVIHSMWSSAGGPLSGVPEPVVMTEEIRAEIKQMSADTTYDGFATADMLDEGD